jgi:uncharacterized protein (DUF58 family)
MNIAATLQELFYRWALRGRPPETSPVVLTQRRVYTLPTRQGLAFAVALLTMLVGAINYNLSLGYALVFLLAGLGISAILHTFRNLAQLRIMPGRSAPVFAGEQAGFSLLLQNLRDEERPAIRINLPGQPIVEVTLPAQSSGEVRLSMPTTSRGWLALPRVTLATTYPLGIIRAWGYAAPDQRCLVYPAPATRFTAPPSTPGESGGATHLATGLEDFAGLRKHQPADPPRHVAWKAVARQDGEELLTKQFTGAAAQSLWFDWAALPAKLDTEARLSLLTRWICDAHGAGLTWGLRLPDGACGPAGDDVHYHACLKRLALYGRS